MIIPTGIHINSSYTFKVSNLLVNIALIELIGGDRKKIQESKKHKNYL